MFYASVLERPSSKSIKDVFFSAKITPAHASLPLILNLLFSIVRNYAEYVVDVKGVERISAFPLLPLQNRVTVAYQKNCEERDDPCSMTDEGRSRFRGF